MTIRINAFSTLDRDKLFSDLMTSSDSKVTVMYNTGDHMTFIRNDYDMLSNLKIVNSIRGYVDEIQTDLHIMCCETLCS